MWDIDYNESADFVTNRLESEWNRYAKQYIHEVSHKTPTRNMSAVYKNNHKNNLNVNEDELILQV